MTTIQPFYCLFYLALLEVFFHRTLDQIKKVLTSHFLSIWLGERLIAAFLTEFLLLQPDLR